MNLVPRLTQLLASDNADIVLESAWALTNIASGESQNTELVVRSDAVPAFVKLLDHDDVRVQEQAVWALGNIAGDTSSYRDLVLRHGAMTKLVDMTPKSIRVALLRNITWTISNLCRGKPQPDFNLVKEALPVLRMLLMHDDEEIVADACWALSYLSDDVSVNDEQPNRKIQAVINASVVPQLVRLLYGSKNQIRTPALRTIGNLVTGDQIQTQVVINSNILPALHSLLSAHRRIKKEACWTISNITAGPARHIEAVAKANIFHALIPILRTPEFDIQKEAAWAICNACSGGTPEHINLIVSLGAIPPLLDLLGKNEVRITLVILEGLRMILDTGAAEAKRLGTANRFVDVVLQSPGYKYLRQLVTSSHKGTREKAITLANTHFPTESSDDIDTGATMNEEDNTFGFGVASAPGGAEDDYRF